MGIDIIGTAGDAVDNAIDVVQGVDLSMPESLNGLSGPAKKLLTDPRGYILVVVYEAIVGGLAKAAMAVASNVLAAFGLAADVPFIVVDGLAAAVAPVGDLLLWPLTGGIQLATSTADAAGSFAPIVVAVEVVLLLVVLQALAAYVAPYLTAALGVVSR